MLELIKTLATDRSMILSSHNLSDIDEVCNHACVVNKGHLIFHGSLQDLKGRIRKNHYEIDLDGDQKTIAKTIGQIKGLKEVVSAQLKHRRLELKLVDDVPNTTILAMVLQTLSDNKITILSFRTPGMQTESAYLELVEKEDHRGFARLYQPLSEAA
jgi:ABC-2 type transport system ATP-binding protein